jgi:hypothetical protein
MATYRVLAMYYLVYIDRQTVDWSKGGLHQKLQNKLVADQPVLLHETKSKKVVVKQGDQIGRFLALVHKLF